MLAVLAFLFLPALQDAPERGRLAGRLKDGAGQAWAGAEVHLWSRAHPLRTDAGAHDYVVVESDARGRFRARTLHGRRYSVWAQAPAAGGRVRFSGVIAAARTGTPVRLIGRTSRAAKRLTVEGADAWKDAGPLRYCLVWPMPGLYEVALELDGDDLVIPPQPVDLYTLRAYTAAGTLFAHLEVREPEKPPTRWSLPLRHRHEISVSRASGGAAVAAADIWIRAADLSSALYRLQPSASRWQRLLHNDRHYVWSKVGTTNAEGRCTFDVPQFGKRLELLVTGPGSRIAWARGLVPNVTLPAGQVVRGRLAAGDVPLAGQPIWPAYKPFVRTGKRSTRAVHFDAPVVRTDADGAFELAGFEDRVAVRLETPLDAATWRALGGKGPTPGGNATVANVVTAASGVQDLGTVDVAALGFMDFRILGPDGQPAPGTHVLLKPVYEGKVHSNKPPPVWVQAGRRGRARVLVPAGEYDAMIVGESAGRILEKLRPGKPTGEPRQVELEAYRRVTVRVVDDGDAPVPGAVISTSGGSYTHIGAMFSEVFAWNCALLSGTTDAKGECVLPVMKWPSQSYSIRASVRRDGRSYRSKARVRVRSDGETNAQDEYIVVIPVPAAADKKGK